MFRLIFATSEALRLDETKQITICSDFSNCYFDFGSGYNHLQIYSF